MGSILRLGPLSNFSPGTYTDNVMSPNGGRLTDELAVLPSIRDKMSILSIDKATYDEDSMHKDTTIFMIYDTVEADPCTPPKPLYSEVISLPEEPVIPNDKKWIIGAEAITPRYNHNVIGADGKIFVMFGKESNDVYCSTVEAYDPKEDSWETYCEIPVEYTRENASICIMNGFAYIFGGNTSITNSYLDYFDFEKKEFGHVIETPIPTKGGLLIQSHYEPNTCIIYGGYGDIEDESGSLYYKNGYSYTIGSDAWVKLSEGIRKIDFGGAICIKDGSPIIATVGSTNYMSENIDDINGVVYTEKDSYSIARYLQDADYGECRATCEFGGDLVFIPEKNNETMDVVHIVDFDTLIEDPLYLPKLASINVGRRKASMISFANKIYLFGGIDKEGIALNSLEIYEDSEILTKYKRAVID